MSDHRYDCSVNEEKIEISIIRGDCIMQKTLKVLILYLLLAIGTVTASANDGTMEGAYFNTDSNGKAGMLLQRDLGTYVITPFESVSIDQTSVWRDNRHRAYYSGRNVNGFLLFDVSDIPNDATIISMTLRCYLENAYGSPNSNPIVDVYYSEDDGWTRDTVSAGQLSLDVLLANDIPFTSYISSYDFELDVSAHDWTQDLLDDQISIGFKNDVSHYSYVYFFGAYGSPVGPPPELIIETGPSLKSLTISPPSGDYVSTQHFDLTLIVEGTGSATITNATWNGNDITTDLNKCVRSGTLISGGETFRCPISGRLLGTGTQTFSATVEVGGSSVTETVTWEVLENSEP